MFPEFKFQQKIQVIVSRTAPNNPSLKEIYTFDRVFNPESKNSQVFKECVKPMIPSLLEGYNTSVMLYGVTGSGKTHTVFGDINNESPQEKGVMNYAMSELFKKLDGKKDVIRISYLEIYNEHVKDLLGASDHNMMVCENHQGDVKVPGLTHVSIRSFKELIALIKNGNRRRKMAKTNSNQFSSRSHAIIQVNLKIMSIRPDNPINSKLSFIDLAGSERITLTENRGLRMTEGSNINKSLLALGNVINKLSSNSSRRMKGYVPYRDSKLTRLLKDSLGGNTKTVLITCITPNMRQIDETIHSLNYATRAKKIKSNVTKNEVDLFEDLLSRGKKKLRESKTVREKDRGEVLLLKKKIDHLQKELCKEKGEKINVERVYEQLVNGMEEHLSLKNSIREIDNYQKVNREKIKILKQKKLKMAKVARGEHELGKLIDQQIKNLEDIMLENVEIKENLVERLEEIIKEREFWLKNGQTSIKAARSKSPIIHRKSSIGSDVLKKKHSKGRMLRHHSTSNIFGSKLRDSFRRSELGRSQRSNFKSCLVDDYLNRRSKAGKNSVTFSPYKENSVKMIKKELVPLIKVERKTEKKKTKQSESSVQETTYILKSTKKPFTNIELEGKMIDSPESYWSLKKEKSENLRNHYLETVKGSNNSRFNLLSENSRNFEFSLEENSNGIVIGADDHKVRTEPHKQPLQYQELGQGGNCSSAERAFEQSKENLKSLISRLNSRNEIVLENRSSNKENIRSRSRSKKDFGNLPTNLNKKKEANFLNTEALQMQSLTNNLKLLQDNLEDFRKVIISTKTISHKDIEIQPILQKNDSNITNSDMALPTPLHPSQIDTNEQTPKINKKLERARKKMRNFKKKLSLMSDFLDKYGKNAVQRGKTDIYKAVKVLIEEQLKGSFKLNDGEMEVFSRMMIFSRSYEDKWGSVDYGCPLSKKKRAY